MSLGYLGSSRFCGFSKSLKLQSPYFWSGSTESRKLHFCSKLHSLWEPIHWHYRPKMLHICASHSSFQGEYKASHDVNCGQAECMNKLCLGLAKPKPKQSKSAEAAMLSLLFKASSWNHPVHKDSKQFWFERKGSAASILTQNWILRMTTVK